MSLARTSWRLQQVQAELAWQKESRDTFWPDPTAINVLHIARPTAALNLRGKRVDWSWRVMLPEDAMYQLRWESSPSLFSEAPRASDVGLSDPVLLLAKGISKLDVSIFALSDGQLRLQLENSGHTTEVDVKGPAGTFDRSGFLHWIAGVKQTKSGDPATSFLLACFREYAADGVPSQGFRVWLELATSPDPNVVIPAPLSK